MKRDATWKLVVKGLKAKVVADRKEAIARVLKDVAGDTVPLRTARKSLLTISVDSLASAPKLVDVHGEGEVCVMSFDDLLELLADPPPTLAEIIATARR